MKKLQNSNTLSENIEIVAREAYDSGIPEFNYLAFIEGAEFNFDCSRVKTPTVLVDGYRDTYVQVISINGCNTIFPEGKHLDMIVFLIELDKLQCQIPLEDRIESIALYQESDDEVIEDYDDEINTLNDTFVDLVQRQWTTLEELFNVTVDRFNNSI